METRWAQGVRLYVTQWPLGSLAKTLSASSRPMIPSALRRLPKVQPSAALGPCTYAPESASALNLPGDSRELRI